MNLSDGARANVEWWMKQIFKSVGFVFLVFVLAIGTYLLFAAVLSGAPLAAGDLQFNDLVQTMLAVFAVFIASANGLIYKVLHADLQRSLESILNTSWRIAETRQQSDDGMLYWNLYRLSTGKPGPVRL